MGRQKKGFFEMLNTAIAFGDEAIHVHGKRFLMKSAGIRDGAPFAVVEPHNEVIESAIIACIERSLPLPPRRTEIRDEIRLATGVFI
jgi:hypothetical protein